MSQYGAYGAARKGLTWKQILAFYYRGTQLTKLPSGTKIKVWITADNDSSLRVLPARARPEVPRTIRAVTAPRSRLVRTRMAGAGEEDMTSPFVGKWP